MTVYISGPITNNPEYRDQFQKAADLLKKQYEMTVLSPTMITAELEYEDYMKIDLAMVEVADAIVMLRGWENSSGARRELYLAKALQKKVFIFEELKWHSTLSTYEPPSETQLVMNN